jgi:hypothetical protein
VRLFTPTQIATVRLTERWHVCKDGDPAGLDLYERHYSAYQYKDGRERKLFCGPGEKLVLLTEEGDALWVWRRFIENHESEPHGVNCAVFRNESPHLASELILEAERVAWCRWPGQRLYTYVNPERTSRNPGYCFLRAGWQRCGKTKGGLLVLEKLPALV